MEQYIGYGYLVIVAACYIVAARRSRGKARAAGASAVKSFISIAPTFLAVFGLVGLLEVFVPPAVVERYLGADGSVAPLVAGALAGSVAAGPPAAGYPLASSLLKSGAWAPAVAAFIVSWTLVGVVSLPFEGKTFGWRFAITRNALSFAFALLIGVLMGVVL
ncbi:MAG: permease [Coriobacteriia bacterium]|nr:permease [Coriobacteriia bacterium]